MEAKKSLRSYLAQAAIAAALAVATNVSALGADQATIDAAKKEGALVYSTNLFAPTTQKALQKAFREYYKLPDSFNIQGYIGSSSSVVSRATQELQANKVTVDWLAVNFATFWKDLQKRGELMKYCSDEYKHLDYVKKAGVIDGGCEFQSVAAIVFGLMWNPQYVKEDLQSWAQLTSPKYKGLLIFGDVRKSAAYLDAYYGLRKNNVWTDEWLQKIKAQKPFFLLRSTDIRDRVMSGEFPIAILGYGPRAYQVRDQVKLKVSWPKEGVVVDGNYGGILAKAPHPNAAKLWNDFIFSAKGQEILVKLEAISTMRSDVAIPADVRPYVADLGKVHAVPVDWADLTKAKLDKMREDFRSIFGQ
ncbi:MAG TPA: extracellular solute-binding protein [Pseudolabrys sp.]|jgi:iron(III) transport system substrate-binding protein|nr:extracellular solute-binding protein [Pseudolabrys sp.]